MQIFPEKVRKLWNEWDLRIMIVLSLSLQIILIGFGNRRKYIARNWIRMILWLAYLSADWVATVALGVLCNNEGDNNDDSTSPSNVIMAFWAPFLLLHLGGPDTITAYSLEDNELWLRHLLGLVVQVGIAFYVFLRSLKPAKLNFLAIPIFFAGIIKYGERTWSLRSASKQHFRQSLLPKPDPGPNYAKFMEEYRLKEIEGFELSCTTIEAPDVVAHTNTSPENSIIPDANILNLGYDFFKTYKLLFADLILSFQDLEKSRFFFQDCTWDKAFKVIEVELGFIFDLFYTKATVVYSSWGAVLRFLSFCSTIFSLVAFSRIDKHDYSKIDVRISFLLLIGAIGLEIFAILVLLSSDWVILWLSKQENLPVILMYKAISCFKFITSKTRWSNYMGQYNLISSFFKDENTRCCGLLKSPWIHKIIENYQYEASEDMSTSIKECIFKWLVEKSKGASECTVCKQLCKCRGEQVLRKYGCRDKIVWSLKVEFDQSILLWHIATELCHSADHRRDKNSILDIKCKLSKFLSDYMLYILVNRSFMLPNGIEQIRFQDTVAEIKEFIQEKKTISNASQACERLLELDTRIPPINVKGDRCKSVLFEACRLAKSLQLLEEEELGHTNQKWELISLVWVEMLSYAASQCRSNQHAEQLRRGGELLTHVWLLMAHLGLTEQFQISQGHARAKLVVI